jgi:hypothetical protein
VYPIPEDYALAGQYGEWFSFFGQCAPLANDTDADGDALTHEIVTQPTHGEAITLDGNPDWTAYRITQPNYSTKAGDQPGGNWVSDSFTYRAFDGTAYSQPATARIWIAPINDPPTLTAGPSSVYVDEDSGAYSSAWATNVSPGPANESDQTVNFELVSSTGEVFGTGPLFSTEPAIDGNGVLTFTLSPDVNGVGHLTFRPRDNGGLENYGVSQMLIQPDDTAAEVSFDIFALSDATQATNDAVNVPAAVVGWRLDVLANDAQSCCPTQQIVAVSQGAAGDVTIVPGGTAVRYTPHLGATSDTFTYTVGDGTGSTDTATVHVTVGGALNIGPVAGDDSVTVAEDSGATSVPVLLNDADVDSDPLRVTAATSGLKGTVTITGGGTGLTYTPNANANGSDTFSYTVSDPGTPHTVHDVLGGVPKSDTATVAVTITSINDAPNAIDDVALGIRQGAGPTAVAVLANDSDTDADPLNITAKTDGAHGTVAIANGGKSLTYDPAGLYSGRDSFTYSVSDGKGGVDTATVRIFVKSPTSGTFLVSPPARFAGRHVMQAFRRS